MPAPSDKPDASRILELISADRAPGDRDRHARNLFSLVDNMARNGHGRTDPVRMIQGYLGDRWSSLIMHLLSGGMLRFTELRRLICLVSSEHEISPRVLTMKLRILERDGLVDRHVTDDTPPRTEYRLTALGIGAYEQFHQLVEWAEAATPSIRMARRDHDARHPQLAASLQKDADRD